MAGENAEKMGAGTITVREWLDQLDPAARVNLLAQFSEADLAREFLEQRMVEPPTLDILSESESLALRAKFIDAIDAANVRGWFLPVATSAAIPAENIDAFAKEVSRLVWNFDAEAQFDRVRRQYEHVIDELLTATKKMISAIERI